MTRLTRFLRKLSDFITGPTIYDSEFGQMRLDKAPVIKKKGSGIIISSYRDYWIGRVTISPLGYEVGIILMDGSRSGPTDEQRSAFRTIVSRWAELYERALNAAEPIAAEWHAAIGYSCLSKNLLRLEGLTIEATRSDVTPMFSFDLDFEPSDYRTGHFITVIFEGWQVARVNVTE